MIEPVSVRLEASSHCQLRCPSCRTTDGSIDQAIGKGFGSNAFTGGLAASVNSEKTTYTRKMLRANAASRADIPCATCEIYLGMQRRGKRLERPEDRKGGSRRQLAADSRNRRRWRRRLSGNRLRRRRWGRRGTSRRGQRRWNHDCKQRGTAQLAEAGCFFGNVGHPFLRS